MSAVVAAVSAAIDVVVAVVTVAIATTLVIFTAGLILLSSDFNDFVLDQLSVIMSLFGIDETDIIESFVSDQRLMPDADLANFYSKLALEHEFSQRNIIDIFSQQTASIRGSFDKYYNNGIDEYTPGLPQASIHTEFIPNDLNVQIDLEYGITSIVETTDLKVPTKDEYLTYVLNNTYGYYPQANTLTYLTESCPVTLTEYNYGTNEYDVHISRGTHTVTETTTTITPYVEAYPLYSSIATYAIDDHVMFDPGTGSVAYKYILDIPVILDTYIDTTEYLVDEYVLYDDGAGVKSYKAIQITLGNLPTDPLYWELLDFTPSNALYWQEVDYENKHVYTTDVTSYDVGGIISTVVVEDSNVLILAGTEVSGVVSNTPGVVGSVNHILHVTAFPASRHYVVKYYDSALTSGDWLYWIYRIVSGTITELDNSNTSTSNLEMLPIIELRRSTVNINSDKLSVKYLETKAILDTIGLDVDEMIKSVNENPSIANIEDAYLYFGLDLKDESPLVAKMVYELFEFMYYDVGLVEESGGYKAIITEGSFNATLIWQRQVRTVNTGVIGPIGATTIATGIDITVSKQETESQYITYTMFKMSSITLIDRGGLWGVTIKTCGGDDSIIIPLSHFYVNDLTPLEQMDIFNRSIRLSIYSAQVTHLEWYETPEFMKTFQVVIQVVGAVLFILSLPAGGSAGVTWASFWAAVLNVAIAYGASLALQYLFEQTDNDFLRAIGTAAILVAAAYGVDASSGAMEFTNAFTLTSATTAYSALNAFTMAGQMDLQKDMERLQREVDSFQKTSEEKFKELEKLSEGLAPGLDTATVTSLATMNPLPGYLEGVDLSRYQASNDAQTNFGALKGIPDSMISGYFDVALRKGVLS